MVFRVFIFIVLVRPDGQKGYSDENNFCYCYGNFSKVPFWKLLDLQLYSKFAFNNYQQHWQQHFERHMTVLRFYGYGSTYVLIFLGQLSWSQYLRRCLQRYQLHKTQGLEFEEHFTIVENDIALFLYAFFSVQQT